MSVKEEKGVHHTKHHQDDRDYFDEVTHKGNLFLDQVQFEVALAFVTVNAFCLDDVGCLAVDVHFLLLAFACLYEFGCDAQLLQVLVLEF